MNKLLKSLVIVLPFFLASCSSTDHVNLMADQRASVLKSKLPLKYGPINFTNARANGNLVEISMIYNQGTSVSSETLVNSAIDGFCNDRETRSIISQGVVYRIIMRNERGSLITDTQIPQALCESLSV